MTQKKALNNFHPISESDSTPERQSIKAPGINSKSSRRGGFTLVELLVVMGVIALLIGLLMPALASARAAAKTTQCRSNLKNLGAGWTLYVKDHPDEMPLAVSLPAPKVSAPPNELTIMEALKAYIDVPAVYHCPADDRNYFADRGTSYEYLPGAAFALDPANMKRIVDIAKQTPALIPILNDGAPFHPAPNIASPELAVYYDAHVDWLFDTLPAGVLP